MNLSIVFAAVALVFNIAMFATIGTDRWQIALYLWIASFVAWAICFSIETRMGR